MTILYMDLLRTRFNYISTAEASNILAVTPFAASRLVRQGKIPGVKIGGVYLVPRSAVLEFAEGYVPRRGRPRTKRRYTKRSDTWAVTEK